MIKLYLVILVFVLEAIVLAASILLKHSSRHLIAFLFYLLSLLPSFILTFVARSFSPSYCATFVVVTHGLLLLSLLLEYLLAKVLPNKKYLLLMPLLVFALGMAFVYPNVFVYCFQDDLLFPLCYVTIGLTVPALVLFILLNHRKEISLWEKISLSAKQTFFFSATLLSLLCGFRQTPVLPYGFGLAAMLLSTFMKKDTGKGQTLCMVLFWLGYGISVFYTLTPSIVL